jgi:hypothetical protein
VIASYCHHVTEKNWLQYPTEKISDWT